MPSLVAVPDRTSERAVIYDVDEIYDVGEVALYRMVVERQPGPRFLRSATVDAGIDVWVGLTHGAPRHSSAADRIVSALRAGSASRSILLVEPKEGAWSASDAIAALLGQKSALMIGGATPRLIPTATDFDPLEAFRTALLAAVRAMASAAALPRSEARDWRLELADKVREAKRRRAELAEGATPPEAAYDDEIRFLESARLPVEARQPILAVSGDAEVGLIWDSADKRRSVTAWFPGDGKLYWSAIAPPPARPTPHEADVSADAPRDLIVAILSLQ